MAQITIKEIAKLCGVSRGTVDRAINDRPGINPHVKQKILSVVKETGYKPDRVAQSLAKGKTMSLGFICFDLVNNFIANLVDVIESVAKENGYFINLILSHGDPEEERKGLEYLAERKVDGIIIFPVGSGEEYVRYLKELKIPIVSIYNKISDDFPCVRVDTRAAMRDAVRYIAEYQYERVVLMNISISKKQKNKINVYNLAEGQKGYEEGLAKYCGQASPPFVVEGLDFAKLDAFLSENKQKTAVLCICDMFALAVLKHLRDVGMKAPEDVGLMGFDHVSMLDYLTPRLATVSYDVKTMAETAFRLLMEMMAEEEKTGEEICVEYKIEQGTSL